LRESGLPCSFLRRARSRYSPLASLCLRLDIMPFFGCCRY
jgi:hypothetical protein